MTESSTSSLISSSLEDYLETIYLLVMEHGFARVKDITKARGVKPATVSVALRRLADAGYLDYERREYIRLTPKGEESARRVLSRHRLLTRFFREVLKMDPVSASEQACALEHSLTDEAMNRFVTFFEVLGACPHLYHALSACPALASGQSGMGSACASCSHGHKAQSSTLAQLEAGQNGEVAQLLGAVEERQRLLDLGLLPETTVELERKSADGEVLWVRCQGALLSLSRQQAAQIQLRRPTLADP